MARTQAGQGKLPGGAIGVFHQLDFPPGGHMTVDFDADPICLGGCVSV
jgi:hypothetical protein